jgi:hypothetical protein
MAKAVRRRSKKAAANKKSPAKGPAAKRRKPRKWSKKVNQTSNALDLEQDVFKKNDPKKIAQSLRRSAQKSKRRKGTAYQSAMSMLNFYINRGGKNLSASRKQVLERSKKELRKLFGREEE